MKIKLRQVFGIKNKSIAKRQEYQYKDYKVIFTDKISEELNDDYLAIAFRKSALENLFTEGPNVNINDLQKKAEEIKSIDLKHLQKYLGYLVIIHEFNAEVNQKIENIKGNLGSMIDLDQYVDHDKVYSNTEILLASFMMYNNFNLELRKLFENKTNYTDNDELIYNIHMSSSAEITTINGLIKFDVPQELINKLDSDVFKTTIRNYSNGILSGVDGYRNFIYYWNALEILINKVYRIAEEDYYKYIEDRYTTNEYKLYLQRQRGVLKDKLRLADKFYLVYDYYTEDTSNIQSDIKLFEDLKKTRDHISHGAIDYHTEYRSGELKKLYEKLMQCVLEKHA